VDHLRGEAHLLTIANTTKKNIDEGGQCGGRAFNGKSSFECTNYPEGGKKDRCHNNKKEKARKIRGGGPLNKKRKKKQGPKKRVFKEAERVWPSLSSKKG